MKNELREIKGFKGYYINNIGEVFSEVRGKLKQRKTSKRNYKKKNDYVVVHLMKDKIRYKRFVHRLVYEAFVGSIPEKYQINHLDLDKTNNSIDNLECVTQSENMQHYHQNKK